MSRPVASLVATLLLGAGCRAGESTAPVVALGPAAHALIDSLVVDEARAEDRYVRVLSRFGTVAPFAELALAPRTRLGVLDAIIAEQEGWVRPDPFAGLVGFEYYQDVAGACGIASLFARGTVARYERVLVMPLPTATRSRLQLNRDDAVAADVARTTNCR